MEIVHSRHGEKSKAFNNGNSWCNLLALFLIQDDSGKAHVMRRTFREILEDTPIVAAIKDMEGLEQCLKSDIQVVFILFGDICSIKDIVKRIKDSGKVAMVHIDLIAGLSGKEIALDYIKEFTEADGIITTKSTLIRHARELGLYTVLRYFVIDSMALVNIEKQNGSVLPDVIEILPGVMPKIIRKVNGISKVPVVAGGLISDREDVMLALDNGAVAISSTSKKVWFM